MAVEVKEGQDIKCRYCGAVRRYDKDSDQRDPDYCSGKCRAADEGGYSQSGEEPMTREVMQQQETSVAEMKPGKQVITTEGRVVVPPKPGTLNDYYARPDAYHRRFDPEKLNWGEHLNLKELQQAGLRANRKPIPGDWDFIKENPDAVQGKEEAPA